MVDTASMSNSALGVTHDFPNRPDVIAYWQSKGWVLVDPNAPEPPVFDPELDAEITGLIGNDTSTTAVALRAALVPRPTGGTNGQALIKSGTAVIWGTVAGGGGSGTPVTATDNGTYLTLDLPAGGSSSTPLTLTDQGSYATLTVG